MSQNQKNTLVASSAIIVGMMTFFSINPWNSERPINLEPQNIVVSYQVQEVVIKDSHAPNYWAIVHEIESKSGANLIRKVDRAKGTTNCRYSSSPIGHFQLSKDALKDIGQWNKSGRAKRCNYSASLEQAKAYKVITDGYGCSHLKGYQSYLIHQEGCSGIKKIIKAKNVRKYKLPKQIIRNMANNSPYSIKTLRKTGGAKKFLKYWERKWDETRASL